MEQDSSGARRVVTFVTGMSGTGKSSVLAELKHRGHEVLDTDDPGWIRQIDVEPLWDLDRLNARLDEHRKGWLFIAGCVANQARLYDRFDLVVLLSAPVDVILARVANRSNPFGSRPADREKIAEDQSAFEPLLRAGADHEVVSIMPIAELADLLEQLSAARQQPRT